MAVDPNTVQFEDFGPPEKVSPNTINFEDFGDPESTTAENIKMEDFGAPIKRSVSTYDAKRRLVVDLPEGVTGNEAEYLIGTEIDKNDKGDYFGLQHLGRDFTFAVLRESLGIAGEVGKDFAVNVIRGGTQRVVSLPGTVGSLLREQGELGGAGLGMPGFRTGISLAELTTGEQVIQRSFLDDVIAQAGLKLRESNEAFLEDRGIEPTRETPLSQFAFDLGSGAVSVATSIGLLYLTKQPAAVAILFGGLQKGEIFEEAREAGKTPQEASIFSSLAGLAEGAIEAIGGAVFLKSIAVNQVTKKAMIRAANEFLQEASQQTAEEAITIPTGIRESTMVDALLRVGYAGLLGMVLGMGTGTVTSIAEKRGVKRMLTEKIGLSEADANKVITQFSEKTVESGEVQESITQMILDEVGGISMTKQERKTRLEEARKEIEAQVARATAQAKPGEEQQRETVENLIRKGQLEQISLELEGIRTELEGLDEEITQRKKEGKPTTALENRVDKLLARASELTNRRVGLTERISLKTKDIKKATDKLAKQVDQVKKRVAKIAITEERKRNKEAQKIIRQVRKADIRNITAKERAEIKKLQQQLAKTNTLAGLRELNNKVQTLKELGKQKHKAITDLKEALFDARKEILLQTLGPLKTRVKVAATKKPTPLLTRVRALTLRAPRLLDMLDGAQDFKGPFHQIFYDLVNQTFNTEVSMIGKMEAKGLEILKANNIKVEELASKIELDTFSVNMSEAMHIYVAMGNEENLNAIIFGNGISPENIDRIVARLPQKFKTAADQYAAELGSHYDRLRLAYIDFTDGREDLPKVLGTYIPMIREGIAHETTDREFADEILTRAGFKTAFAAREFTRQRQQLSEENQTSIRLGLVEIYFQHSSKREHFIAMGSTIKDLQRLINDRDIRESVTEKFGNETYTILRSYMNRVATPKVQMSMNKVEQFLKIRAAREATAMVHLGFNLVVSLKQVPSVAIFLAEVGPIELMSGIGQMLSDWNGTVEFIHKRDPQLANRRIEQFIDELKRLDLKKYESSIGRLVQRFGRDHAFDMIKVMDQFATHAGWKAKYDQMIRIGASEDEAIDAAQKAVLRTQPASAEKDIAEIYSSSETMNLLLQFTQQLSQNYNLITWDLAQQLRKGFRAFRQEGPLSRTGLDRFQIGIRGGFGLMISYALINILSRGRLPEDEEELTQGAVEAFFATIPIVGSMLNGLNKGFDPLPAAIDLFLAKPFQAGAALLEGDFEKALDKGLYFAAGRFKIPYTQIRRSAMGVSDLADGNADDYRRLIYSEFQLEG